MHDSSYKSLYAFRRFFEALVRALAPEWARRIDFRGARQLSAEYPAEGRPTRYGDMLWAATLHDGGHLLVPIEFQTTADPTMPLRVAGYTAHALLEWTRSHPFPGRRLPFALPIVIYGGRRAWRVPTTLAELYPPDRAGLLADQLDCRYHLLDEQRGKDPLPDGNLVTHLVHIARARSTERMIALIETVRRELGRDSGGALDRAVTRWIKRVLIDPPPEIAAATTLEEVLEVLTPKGKWAILWYEDGIEAGQKQGREQGLEQAFHQLVALRFGDDTLRALTELSLAPANPERLGALMKTALECATGDEFLERMQLAQMRNGGPAPPSGGTRRDPVGADP